MAHRTPEGKIIDSRKATSREKGTVAETDLTQNNPPPPAAQSSGSGGARRFEDETILPELRRKPEKAKPPAPENDVQTRRFGAKRATASGTPEPAISPQVGGALPKSVETHQSSDFPVVGWLVIVDGPGKGRAREIVSGRNAVGRGADNDISLDFGDSQISRVKHAVISYDPRGRRFYIQHGEGANLTYLGDQPVLSPCELEAFSPITLGDTVLRFVPFCGSDFDWQDTQAGAEEA